MNENPPGADENHSFKVRFQTMHRILLQAEIVGEKNVVPLVLRERIARMRTVLNVVSTYLDNNPTKRLATINWEEDLKIAPLERADFESEKLDINVQDLSLETPEDAIAAIEDYSQKLNEYIRKQSPIFSDEYKPSDVLPQSEITPEENPDYPTNTFKQTLQDAYDETERLKRDNDKE